MGSESESDELLRGLKRHMEAEDEDESPWDSQATENEDPNFPPPPPPKRQRYTSPPCHFSKSCEFWDSVEKVVTHYMDDAWFSIADRTFDDLSEDWDHNVSGVATAIKSIAIEAREFKIGICVDPKWRWFVCAGGAHSRSFTKMTLVSVANSSKPNDRQSTGNMEKTQISRFKGMCGDKCMNKAPGGEGASDGSPHFCYVVSM